MATAYTKADALGLYLSGASLAAGAQDRPSLCLGGYSSSTEVKRRGFVVRGGGLRPLRVDWISGSNAIGEGLLTGNGASGVGWQSPSSASIAPITISNGESKLVESATALESIRVTRMSTNALRGLLQIGVVNIFNDLLGFDNISSADATAGKANYRAAFIRNHSGSTVTGIKVWIKTLGTQRVSGTAQLDGSGSGTITTATANGFADWPTSGWCHIKNAGTTREIVYYTSRTATSLTVPSAGRARLGTSAGAGAGTDTIDAVPGIRVGLEAPSSNAIQTITNETTAPSAITWNVQTTSAAGLSIASLAASADYGLWIHRDTPAGLYAGAQIENALNIEFVYSAATYATTWNALYRAENSALRLYELYSGTDTAPSFTTPVTTSATLPFDYALTPPGAGNREYQLTVRERNGYNLASLNTYARKVKIDSAGAEVTRNPTGPFNISLSDAGGGMVRVQANYEAQDDDPRADQWAIRLGNASDPTGSETADYYDMRIETFGFARNIPLPLNQIVGPFVLNQDLRALVRVRHRSSNTESTNTTAAQLTVGSGPVGLPLRPTIGIGLGQEQRRSGAGTAGTSIIDAANNIYWSWDAGYLDLWIDTDLIFRIRYDSSGAANNGIWTTYAFIQETISGTPASEPVEVASATLIYITANGVRRMKIDKTVGTISFTSLNDQVLTRRSSTSSGPVFDATFASLFQVYDPYAGDYATALDLDSDGTLRMNVPWRQRATVGAFE
jgi:hypothetical protein